MPKHPVVRGHPIHAALSDLPAALVPTALLLTALDRVRSTEGTRFASAATTWLALLGSLGAGAAGWWDWTTMPRDWDGWFKASAHGVINTAGLGALASAALRPRRRLRMLAAATSAVLAGGVIGGEIVFRHGWRVRKAEEIEIVETQLRQDHLERYVERAREEVERFEREQTYLAGN